ncbi:hypothetical protein [Microbacterium testaceum]|uniref:hypothetical protein n=1 Tax=Microbacterium testaceum TaxID=2033 RepID=UPI000A8A348D|nr:hypothetical protein [Microbacterium testaceum]
MIRRPVLGACREWRGCKHESGYDLLHVRPRMVKVHRVMLEARIGEDLGERFALHRCDNPPYIHPDHLHPGDAQRNLRDAMEPGRWDPREFGARATRRRKVTPEIQESVLADLAAGGNKNATAHTLGLSWPTVNLIVKRADTERS